MNDRPPDCINEPTLKAIEIVDEQISHGMWWVGYILEDRLPRQASLLLHFFSCPFFRCYFTPLSHTPGSL